MLCRASYRSFAELAGVSVKFVARLFEVAGVLLVLSAGYWVKRISAAEEAS